MLRDLNTRSSRSRPPLLIFGAIVAALTLFGCGSGDDGGREGVESVVADFVNAANERDFERVCELMTSQARGQEVGAASPKGCAEALGATELEEQGDIDIEFVDVRISGERAAADIRVKDADSGNRDQALELVREDGQWRISEFS